VSASHRFQGDAEAAQLISEIAGPGRFRIALRSHRTFWYTSQDLSGDVDLTCGIDCFGDSGLSRVTGNPLGVDPGPLAGAAGQAADSVFTFSLGARLPGQLQTTNAAQRQGALLTWIPTLGRSLPVMAATRSLNQASVVGVAVGGGLLVLATVGFVGWRVRRRRRLRRDAGRGEAGPPGGETVTPPS
jgi:hypothetical protein